MRWYAIAMTVHVLGIIALFAGLAMQHRAGSRLRQSTTYDAARPWADLLKGTRAMVPSGAAMLLLSGGYMASRFASNPPPWVVVAAIVMLVVGVVGLVVARRFAAFDRAIATGTGSLTAVDAHRIASPVTWALHAGANGAALGIIWVMAAKPGWLEGGLVVTIATVIGAIAGVQVARRSRGFAHATT